jgi:hypothetical protein
MHFPFVDGAPTMIEEGEFPTWPESESGKSLGTAWLNDEELPSPGAP